MNGRAARSVVLAAWVGTTGSWCIACNERFEYDVPRGDAGSGGSVAGSQAVAGGGATSGGGSSGGGAAGAASERCGTGPACPSGLRCVDGACHQCENDADCATIGLLRCDPARRRCVQCLVAADCPSDTSCDPVANHCLRTCSADLPCPADAHGCDEDRMVCYECDEDRECEQSPLGTFCAPDGSGCVECRGSLGCDAPKHCDELAGRCVECRDGSDCASLLCDPQLYRCLPS